MRGVPARRLARVALVAAAVAALGCGGGGGSNDSGRTVQRTLRTYLAAFATGDGKSACSVLSPTGREALATFAEGLEPAGCEATFEELVKRTVLPKRASRAAIRKVSVNGSRATAEVVLTKPRLVGGVLFVKQDGSWMLAYPPGFPTRNPDTHPIRDESR